MLSRFDLNVYYLLLTKILPTYTETLKQEPETETVALYQYMKLKPTYVSVSECVYTSLFSIPPISTKTERVFSGTRRTITQDRTRLGSKIVEYTEYIKSWITIPKGKQRPLLTGVFRSAKEVDKAYSILLEDTTRTRQVEEADIERVDMVDKAL